MEGFRRWGGGWEGAVNRGQTGKAEQQGDKRFRVKVHWLKKWHYSIAMLVYLLFAGECWLLVSD